MTTKADNLAQVQGLRRLKNLTVRSVGLVDRPAIEEPFTGFKRGQAPADKGRKASTRREEPQEVRMNEEMKAALEQMFKSALAPIVERLDKVEAKAKELGEADGGKSSEAVEALTSTVEELKSKVSGLVDELKSISEKKSVDADGLKAAMEEAGQKFASDVDQIVEDTCKRFEAIEGRVEAMESKGSQKLNGQDTDPEGKKSRWPSFDRFTKTADGDGSDS